MKIKEIAGETANRPAARRLQYKVSMKNRTVVVLSLVVGLFAVVFLARSRRRDEEKPPERDRAATPAPIVNPGSGKVVKEPPTPEDARAKWRRRIDALRSRVAAKQRELSLEVIKELAHSGLEGLPVLLEALKAETDPAMRQALLEALDDILPACFGDFEDGWYTNRAEMLLAARDPANRALFEAFRKEAVPALIDVLKNDADILTRRYSASALGQFGGPESAKALVEMAKSEKESGVLGWIQHALGQFWDADCLPVLRSVLDDPTSSKELKVAVAHSLGMIGTPEAVDLLLRDGEKLLPFRYFHALAESGDPRSMTEIRAKSLRPLNHWDLEALVRFFPTDPFVRETIDRTIRDPAKSTEEKLQLLGGPILELTEARDWLISAYGSAGGLQRESILYSLAHTTPKSDLWPRLLESETDPLLRLLIRSLYPGAVSVDAREEVQKLLGGGESERAQKLINLMWRDPVRWKGALEAAAPALSDPTMRLTVASMLGRAGDRENSGRMLLELYRTGEPGMRIRALAALAQYHPASVREMLAEVTAAASGEDARLRNAAFQALGAFGGEDVRNFLLQAVQRHPGEAILQMGRAGVDVATIVRYASDSRTEIRHAAIQTLGTAVDRGAAETALWEVLSREPEPSLRQVGVHSLGAVGTRETAQRLDALGAADPALSGAVKTAKEAIFLRELGR